MPKIMEEDRICIFPTMGYWEIDGRPVSSREAHSGLHPLAKWIRISHSKCCLKGLDRS